MLKYNTHNINIVSKSDIPENYRFIRTQIDAETESIYCVYADPVSFDDFRKTPMLLAFKNTDANTEYFLFVHGSGHFAINMNSAFPMPKKDFSKICDYVNTANNRETAAQKMHNYISGQLKIVNTELETCVTNTGYKTKVIAQIKKWNAMIETLKKFFFDILPDAKTEENAEIVKTKTTTVYPLCHESGKGTFIDTTTGYKFIKYGILFHAYKNKKTGYHYTIIPCTGLSVGIMEKTKNKLIAAITEKTAKLITDIFNNELKINSYYEKFVSVMTECGYSDVLTLDDFILPVKQKTPTETTATVTEETPTGTEATAEPETAYTAIQEPKTLPDTQHIDIMAFCAEYRQILQKLRCDPLYLPRSRPADRQTRKRAISFYDDTLRKTELVTRFITAVHDIIDTAQKATAFTLAYYAIVNRPATETAHRNGLQVHSVYYRQARHTMPTGRTETPCTAVFYTVPGRLCQQNNRHAQKQKTGFLLFPCLVFRTIPGSVCTCRAIVTDSS